MSIAAIGGIIILGMAITYDSTGTVKLVVAVISIRGVTWIVKKITQEISLDASQIIDFTGWSIAGISIVKIISNAMGSVDKVKDFFISISNFFAHVAEFADKVTFWN